MLIEEYAWNLHEQDLKLKNGNLYSASKIKLKDDKLLRNKLMIILEEITQFQLVIWAINISMPLLKYLDNNLQNDPRIEKALDILTQRLKDQLKVSVLRNVGFEINRLSKESTSEISKIAAKCFSQAIAVGHMRGHALVSSDYCINLANLLNKSPTVERQGQIDIAKKVIGNKSNELLWTVD
ncbi:putative immunity protein [Miniphocaeibacter halophilus]|uniref:Uncharacterized protein n=1 Tax=Miniphocaeibacter halophilus TaxID=2931922 RepID=A0AC61MTA7_9FIRM|nr:hypothetical protein [Miniphocaeibacter halophilus]QQK08054.1 hypothetical protein JFY71_00520 [Miniphocaeibacter halophilus]